MVVERVVNYLSKNRKSCQFLIKLKVNIITYTPFSLIIFWKEGIFIDYQYFKRHAMYIIKYYLLEINDHNHYDL